MEAAIAADPLRLVSCASKLSAALTLTERHGPDAPARLDRLLSEINASVVPFDEPQADIAASGLRALWPRAAMPLRSTGRPARLTRWRSSEAEPLLFAGGGLAETDAEGA